MAAAPPSYEAGHRRAFRYALGLTAAMALTQFAPWPLAMIALALTNLLLHDAKPMPLGKGFVTVVKTIAAVAGGFLISLALVNYPAIMVLTLGLAFYALYIYVMTTGEHFFIVIGMLIGTTVIPIVTRLLPELAYVATLCTALSILVSWLVATLAFALITPPAQVPLSQAQSEDSMDVNGVAATLALVVVSILAIFLYFGISDVLVALYAAIFAMGASSAGSRYMAWSNLKGNLIFGGLATIIVFEFLVIAPFLPLMICILFVAFYIFGFNLFSHKASAGEWDSGSYGFIILLSGLLGSDSVVASAKVVDRVVQIGAAALYVTFAFACLEFVRQWWPSHAANGRQA